MQFLVQELVLFLNREPLFFLLSNLVNPNLMGLVTLIQPTAISCIINFVFPSFNGIQDRRAGTPPILSRRPVESSMRLFFKKPVIMSRTPLISSLHTMATRTSLSCSTRTPLSPTLWVFAFREDSTSKGAVWSYSSFEASYDALHFLEHRRSHLALCTSTMSWPRNVTLPLIMYDGYMAA